MGCLILLAALAIAFAADRIWPGYGFVAFCLSAVVLNWIDDFIPRRNVEEEEEEPVQLPRAPRRRAAVPAPPKEKKPRRRKNHWKIKAPERKIDLQTPPTFIEVGDEQLPTLRNSFNAQGPERKETD